MTVNALSGLIMMNAKAPETVSASKSAFKTPAKTDKTADDSFAGIFQDKLRDASKPSQRADRASDSKPLETAQRKDTSDQEMPVQNDKASVKKPDGTEKSSAKGKPSEVKVDKEDEKDAKKSGDSDSTDEASMLNQLAALLDSLFGKIKEIASGDTGEKTVDAVSATDQAASGNPLDMIKKLLDGNMDKIKELLDKIQPKAADAEAQPLLDQLKDLVAKLDELKNSAAVDKNGKITIELQGSEEDPATLIAQLQSQGKGIMDKLKIKLTENAKPAEVLTSAVAQEIKLEKPTGKNADSAADVTTDTGMADKDDTALKAKNDEDQPKAQHASEDLPAKAEKSVKADTQVQGQAKTATSPNQALQDRAVLDVQPQKFDAPTAVKPEKTDFQLTEKPLSQTVANQVMMKVKLMAGDNKQEMEVSLKPDYLGKLTLKITHERGEVLAKITTESEQVKAILESNMQLLKDSLEKSGFSVQGLNVSVGNQNGGGQAQNRESQKDGSNNGKQVSSASSANTASARRIIFNQGLTEGSSSIDLSA